MVSKEQLNSIWWIFLIILFMIIPFLIITYWIGKLRQWQRTLIAETSSLVHFLQKWKLWCSLLSQNWSSDKAHHCQFLMKAAVVLTKIQWLYWLNKWAFSKSIYRVKCRIYLFKFKSIIIKNVAQKLESLTVKTSSFRYQ